MFAFISLSNQNQLCPKYNVAEAEGFEPPIPTTGMLVFKTNAFDHSAKLPKLCR